MDKIILFNALWPSIFTTPVSLWMVNSALLICNQLIRSRTEASPGNDLSAPVSQSIVHCALSPVSTHSFWPTATPAHPAQSVLDHTCFPPHLSPIFDQSVFVYSGDSLCPVSWHKDIITAGSKHSVILLLRGETLHFTLQLRRTISHLILYQVIKIFKYDCP